jgi:hypothetical protein
MLVPTGAFSITKCPLVSVKADATGLPLISQLQFGPGVIGSSGALGTKTATLYKGSSPEGMYTVPEMVVLPPFSQVTCWQASPWQPDAEPEPPAALGGMSKPVISSPVADEPPPDPLLPGSLPDPPPDLFDPGIDTLLPALVAPSPLQAMPLSATASVNPPRINPLKRCNIHDSTLTH